MKGLLSLSFIAGVLMTSCHSYTAPDYEEGKLDVTGDIDFIRIRSIGSAWTSGDAIGLSSDVGQNNVKFTTGGDGRFISTTPVYVPETGTVTYTAYYPYRDNMSAASTVIHFSSPEDFMWASTTATRKNPKASFMFRHKMSKISVTMFDSRDDASEMSGALLLNGMAVSGKFDTLTGVVTADNTLTHVSSDFKTGATVSFILPVQNLDEEISVTIFYREMEFKGSFGLKQLSESAEYHYLVDLTNATPTTPLSISSATITGWTITEGGQINIDS